MSENLAAELAEAGKLSESASALARSGPLSFAGETVACYLDAESGRLEKAKRGARSLLTKRIDDAQRARCHEVLSSIAFKTGRVDEGLRHYHSAVHSAEASSGSPAAARMLARLVPILAHALGHSESLDEAARLRRLALKSADRFALVSIHTLVAECEAKRGHIGLALTHLDVASRHLDLSPHPLQEAQWCLVATGIYDRLADVERAHACAIRALRLAESSGSRSMLIPALGNLAHIELAIGCHEDCDRHIAHALSLAHQGGATEIGLRDTKEQLLLALGHDDEAESHGVGTTDAANALADPYYGLWHRLTSVRLLLRTDRAGDAVALALDAIPRIEKMDDRNLLARMRLLAAEGLTLTGRVAEGAALHADVVLGAVDPPLDLTAEASRVAGRIAGRDLPAALGHFARATRILERTGHVTAQREVARHARQALHAAGLAVPEEPPWHDLPALYGLHSTTDPQTATRLPLVRDAEPPSALTRPATARTLDALAAAFDLAGFPTLLGQELVPLLHDAAVARAVALVERDADGHARALCHAGCAPERALTLGREPGAVHIDLGTERDRRVTIHVRPAPAPSAQATIAAAARLAARARELHEMRRLERERAALWPEETPEQQLGFIVASEVMTDLVRTMHRVAAGNVPVLITGETGTGKELLARALHDSSPRRDRPFVPFNCTAVPRDMVDSQLFGYRRGAFTGAVDGFAGVIRAAAGGTLLLDEIGEIGLDVQPKLLRFLESGEVHPLGEPAPSPVDVRVVAATNRPIETLVADGRFREDLYYRLNVVRLEIPPLRDRREEIPLLVHYYLEKWSRETQKHGLRIAEETMEYLVLYRWPGNVRELANELRRMVALAESDAVLMPEHLNRTLAASRRTLPPSARALDATELVVRIDQPLSAAVEHVERAMIQKALAAHDHRVEDAARELGLSRKGLYLKRQRLGLE